MESIEIFCLIEQNINEDNTICNIIVNSGKLSQIAIAVRSNNKSAAVRFLPVK